MMKKEPIKIVECPRDAMQGLETFIPTEVKIAYLNQLLKVGFHTLDFGSFVSPKAIPQMADTAEVLEALDLSATTTKLLAIVANERGAMDACKYKEIAYLGYPFSISETFQQRNTNADIQTSVARLKSITEICKFHGKTPVVYISMGFGNPYGDPWNVEIVQKWVSELANMGIGIMSLSDTIGIAKPESIEYLFSHLISQYPETEFGAHLHTEPHNWLEKVDTAYRCGCRRFDGAMRGFGGCPMAADDLTGNMPTENLVQYFDVKEEKLSIDRDAIRESMRMALKIFPG